MLIKSTVINNISPVNKKIFEESVFFDIETTGLNPKNSKLVMIGVLYYEKDKYNLLQLFSEKNAEKEVIEKFNELIKKYKYLISYNGNNFDLKFIKYRSNINNINISLDKKCLVDLLRVFRVNKNYFNTENLKLKTVEKFSDIQREDKLSGKDFVKLYKSYLLNPKKEYLELMWEHNFEDIKNLPKLFKNYNLFENKLSITYKEYLLDIFINSKSISIINNRIKINAVTYNINTWDTIIKDFNYSLDWNKKTGSMSFEILTKKGKLKNGSTLNYLDLKDVFDLKLFFSNNLNIPENFLVLSVNDKPKKNNILKFISLLFKYKKIP